MRIPCLADVGEADPARPANRVSTVRIAPVERDPVPGYGIVPEQVDMKRGIIPVPRFLVGLEDTAFEQAEVQLLAFGRDSESASVCMEVTRMEVAPYDGALPVRLIGLDPRFLRVVVLGLKIEFEEKPFWFHAARPGELFDGVTIGARISREKDAAAHGRHRTGHPASRKQHARTSR